MDKKYFETKTGSLEDVSTKIAKEQPSITKPEVNVKLTTEKNYLGNKPGSLSDIAAKIVSEAVDPVNKDAVKKDFADRKDKDLDNDGDSDSSDEYLHKKRQAISKSMKESKADFLRLNFANNQTVKKAEKWLYNNMGHSNPGYTSIIADKNSIEFKDMNDADSVMTKLKRAGFNFKVDMRESKAYMLSYGKKGEKAKFFYGNSLSDIQKKAHELRKQGIVVDKMGRTEPTHKLRQTIESVNPDDAGEKINDKKKELAKSGEKSVIKPLQELEKECPQCQGKGCDHCDDKGTHTVKENKKTFKEIRIQAGEGSKTDTGKKTAVIDTEPSTKPI